MSSIRNSPHLSVELEIQVNQPSWRRAINTTQCDINLCLQPYLSDDRRVRHWNWNKWDVRRSDFTSVGLLVRSMITFSLLELSSSLDLTHITWKSQRCATLVLVWWRQHSFKQWHKGDILSIEAVTEREKLIRHCTNWVEVGPTFSADESTQIDVQSNDS